MKLQITIVFFLDEICSVYIWWRFRCIRIESFLRITHTVATYFLRIFTKTFFAFEDSSQVIINTVIQD